LRAGGAWSSSPPWNTEGKKRRRRDAGNGSDTGKEQEKNLRKTRTEITGKSPEKRRKIVLSTSGFRAWIIV
jgi:hypothetical protein